MKRHAAVLAGFDPDVAAWIASAMRGYRRALEQAGRLVLPPGVDEAEAALWRISSDLSRHALASGAAAGEGAGGTSVAAHQRLGLNLNEAAALVGLSRRSLERAVAAEELPVCRIGRRVIVDPNDLQEWTQCRRSSG